MLQNKNGSLRCGRRGGGAAPIFNRHYPLLLGDIYRIVPDEDTCKDLAQEVFVELWRKRANWISILP